MSDTSLDRVTQDAQRKSGEAWREAADHVGSDRVALEKKANEAQNEAELFAQRSSLKSDEAAVYRRDSSTLESAEAAMAAKADTASKAPGISDRLRAGMDSMKDKLSSTFGSAKSSIEETGDRASEKYNTSMASVKESAAESMASTATKSADAAERMKDSAQKSLDKAQVARDKAEIQREQREVNIRGSDFRSGSDHRGSELDKERTTTTTTHVSSDERVDRMDMDPKDRDVSDRSERVDDRNRDRDRGDRDDRDDRGSTKDYLKEKASGAVENAAESVGDKARSTEESMGERRRDAQLAQGKIPERL